MLIIDTNGAIGSCCTFTACATVTSLCAQHNHNEEQEAKKKIIIIKYNALWNAQANQEHWLFCYTDQQNEMEHYFLVAISSTDVRWRKERQDIYQQLNTDIKSLIIDQISQEYNYIKLLSFQLFSLEIM